MSNIDIEGILDEFDFHKVMVAMHALDWKYCDSVDEVTVPELRRVARECLKGLVVSAPHNTLYRTGGFEAYRDSNFYGLRFVVEDIDSGYLP